MSFNNKIKGTPIHKTIKRFLNFLAFLCYLVIINCYGFLSLSYFAKDSSLLERHQEAINIFHSSDLMKGAEYSFLYYIGITSLILLIGFLYQNFVSKFSKSAIIIYVVFSCLWMLWTGFSTIIIPIFYIIITLLIWLTGWRYYESFFTFSKAGIMIYILFFLTCLVGSNQYLKITYTTDGIIERADYRYDSGYFVTPSLLYYKMRHNISLPHKHTYEMQVLLNKAGYYNFKLDGVPSKKIAKQFLKFQHNHNLHIDGILGVKTLEKLAICIYELELKDLKKYNDIEKIKTNVKDFKNNDTILNEFLIPKYDYFIYGAMFLDELNIEPKNFSWQKIDSVFYKMILKERNLDLHDQIYTSLKWADRADSIFIETLSSEFLDTLLKMKNKNYLN